MATAHIPSPLLWEITRNRSALTVKRRTGGGVEFSRDPLNLTNRHSRKFDGYVNDKAFGIQPSENGGLTLHVKKSDNGHKPSSAHQTSTFGSSKSSRKIYSTIVNSTAKKGYRADLRGPAVARASAIKKSHKPVKERPAAKPRGKKAKQAEEKA